MEFGAYFEQAWDNATESAKSSFDEFAKTVKDKSKDVSHAVGQQIDDLKQTISDKATQINDAVEEQLSNIQQTAQEVYNASEQLVNQIGEATNYAIDELQDTAQRAYDRSEKMVKQIAQSTSDKIDELKQEANAAYEQSKKVAKQLTNATKDKINDVKNDAVKAYQQSKQALEQAKTAVKNRVNQAKQVAKSTYVAGKTLAKLTAKKVKQQIDAAKQSVKDFFFKPKPAGNKIEFCECKTKAERVAYRSKKMDEAAAVLEDMEDGKPKDALQKALDRFKFNNAAVERARLAADAYSVGQSTPPEGWERPDISELKELGIDTKHFPTLDPTFDINQLESGGFFVDIYKSKPDVFGEEKYIIAFRGTVFDSKEDWTANAQQMIGKKSDHYSKAQALAQSVALGAKENLGDQLEITGHSLGGGLATTVGIISGAKTYAFNPAGVHPATLERAGPYTRDMANKTDSNGRPLVDNVIVNGEILDVAQSPATQRSLLALGIITAPKITGVAAAASPKAVLSQGTLSYNSPGNNNYVNYTANAKEVAEATATGQSVQALEPSRIGKLNTIVNPLTKTDMHGMDAVIAGIEQQKTDDMSQIESNT